MYDYFVACLRCPHCGAVSPATASTNMQTYIRGDADGSELPVGYVLDPTDLTVRHLIGADYAIVATPAGERIRLLDVWTCPTCETEQWAMIEIAKHRIDRIDAVILNRASFEAANFVSGTHAALVAQPLMEVAPGGQRPDNIEVLRQKLK